MSVEGVNGGSTPALLLNNARFLDAVLSIAATTSHGR
jgi:hypothetical protein